MFTPKREKKSKVRRKTYLKRKFKKLNHTSLEKNRRVGGRITEEVWRRKCSEQ